MLDLALALFVAGLIALGLKRPFIWVLAYIYVDVVAPQQIGWAIMPALKISLVTFLLAFGGWVLLDGKQGSRFTLRQWVMTGLLGWCALSTFLWADFPEAAAEKWAWVWKALLFAIFLPLALRTRLRLEAAALVMVLSASAIIVSGGIKTLAGGGGYGTLTTLVAENNGIYEGSTLSMVAIAIVPLIWWLVRHGSILPRGRPAIAFGAALTLACLLIPVGTQTRTGLLCIAVLLALTLRSVKYRFVYGGLAGFALLAAIPFLPAEYTERMGTIAEYQGDESASTRVQVWGWTLDYVGENPLGGGFDAFLGNSFTYTTSREVEIGGATTVVREEVTDEGRAYHSAYFEVLGEQGVVGFCLWALLHLAGLWRMERIRRAGRRSDDPERRRWAAFATALQHAQIIALVGALFVGIAYQPFILMVLGLQIALGSQVAAGDRQAKEVLRRERLAQARARRSEQGGADAVPA